ncbi:MAG: hypothetical protein ACKPKO_59925, partial [Candidatus Fonsibacter sp.]
FLQFGLYLRQIAAKTGWILSNLKTVSAAIGNGTSYETFYQYKGSQRKDPKMKINSNAYQNHLLVNYLPFMMSRTPEN